MLVAAMLVLAACGGPDGEPGNAHAQSTADLGADRPRGPNGGYLLSDGPFSIELAIFETGVPPEYHAWPRLDGKPVPLDKVQLVVELTRLGGRIDRFEFAPAGDYLRGNGTVTEPHSFAVKVIAQHAGKNHQWSYDSFEGRTTIDSAIAQGAGIQTEVAGPVKLVDTLILYGTVVPDPSRRREISARFPGLIRKVHTEPGQAVRAGEALVSIESNESLQVYTVTAPISGVVTARAANVGEQSGDRTLVTIVDPSSVWAEVSVFPKDRVRVRVGAPAQVRVADDPATADGTVDRISVQAGANQSVIAHIALNNPDGRLVPGTFITASVEVAERNVPLAVRTNALQPFRDFTVVFEQIGTTYEVRMLELGERRGEWVEVLGGLEPGARYVTEGSYVLKADVEKSGASHDH